MKSQFSIILLIVLVSGCGVSGNYRSDGPCRGFNVDPAACERAAANSLVVGKVQLGQSPEEVRKIMGNDPERRDVTESIETWGYRTNYDERRFTRITFENGKVSSIEQYSD
jgi:hypothetical protein